MHWYRLAAEQGHIDAQFNLATIHYEGLIVKQDHVKARYLFEQLSKKGHAQAQMALGVMHYTGQAGAVNQHQAAQLFALAAAQGHAEAQRNLGVMRMRGEGGPRDIEEAERLFQSAIAGGSQAAHRNLQALLSSVGHDDIDEDDNGEEDDNDAYNPLADHSLSEEQQRGASCAQYLCRTVDDVDIFWQVVLQDLDGATMGNASAHAFALSSGIEPALYRGALTRTGADSEDVDSIRSVLDALAFEYVRDSDKVARCRLASTDYIMRHFGFGKYGH